MQIADFVEKERAPVGQFEFAAPHGSCAGERAFLVSEKLALDQFAGNSSAIHFDERTAGEGAGSVDMRSKQFLACARFANQQDSRIGSGGHAGLLDRALERRALPDHPAARPDGFSQPPVLLFEHALLQRVLDCDHYAVAAQRLFEEIERPGAGRCHRIGDGRVAGNHDDRRRQVRRLQFAQQIDTA